MAHINLTVAYGENVIQQHGKHLTKANEEVLIATTSALAQFWFVDVLPFCELAPFLVIKPRSLRRSHQWSIFLHGSPVRISSELQWPIVN